VREAFEAALGLPPVEQRRATLPYTLSAGWPDANPERFEEIVAATLEHPTPMKTIETHMAACYAFYDEGVEVERITARALVVHGAEDLIVPPENGRILARRLPNARHVEVVGRGHNLQLEDPETFNELVLGFLGEPS
jgi:pimeloyl-ACP methyl ester carboxylesterase